MCNHVSSIATFSTHTQRRLLLCCYIYLLSICLYLFRLLSCILALAPTVKSFWGILNLYYEAPRLGPFAKSVQSVTALLIPTRWLIMHPKFWRFCIRLLYSNSFCSPATSRDITLTCKVTRKEVVSTLTQQLLSSPAAVLSPSLITGSSSLTTTA